jgi:hypothetical protein
MHEIKIQLYDVANFQYNLSWGLQLHGGCINSSRRHLSLKRIQQDGINHKAVGIGLDLIKPLWFMNREAPARVSLLLIHEHI